MAVDREAALSWYRRNRDRSRQLFDMLPEQVYYSRPIALRHPIVFYEGHLPGFSFNTLVKKGLGGPSIDPRLETLFARGIDPHESQANGHQASWPDRDAVRAFAAEADARVIDALSREELDRPGHPLLDRAEAVFSILEHEAMHQETLLYMWHRLGFDEKHRPDGYAPVDRWQDARRGVDRYSRRPRGPRRRPFRRAVRLGQRVPGVHGGRAGVFDPAPQRDQRPVPRVRRGRRLQRQPLVERRGLALGRERARRAPAVLGALGWRLAVARDVRHGPAAAVVAGVREPRGSRGIRALARAAPADRSRVPARRIR